MGVVSRPTLGNRKCGDRVGPYVGDGTGKVAALVGVDGRSGRWCGV